MKISDGEKLIILMLTELYQKLDVEGEIDPEFIRSAIFSDNIWSVPWKYPGIPFTDQETPDVVKEVLDILDMWHLIEYSYTNFSDEEKTKLVEGAGVFGKDPKFGGFDGNNESTHMGTALFIVNDLDRFQEFAGRNMNSHMRSLDGYRRMLQKFESMRRNYERFDVDNLITLLNEQIHPENRK